MRSALVSVNGLKNEVYSCVARLFWLWIKERGIFMCSALVLAHRLKNEESSCVARLFWLIVH